MNKLYRLIYYSPKLGYTFIRFANNKLTLKEFLIEEKEKYERELKFWIIQENNSVQIINEINIFGNSWNTIEICPEMQKIYKTIDKEANPELETFKEIIKLCQQQSQ